MKKIFRRRSSSAASEAQPDVAVLINKMQEQLTSLEKKIDILINRPSERNLGGGYFSKPFQRFGHSRFNDKTRQDSNFRRTNFTRAICADCKKECEVPFKPSGDRPVYCKDCFSKRKDRGSFKERHDDAPREIGFSQERRFDKSKKYRKSKGKPVGFHKST